MTNQGKMNKPYPAQTWRMPPLSTIWLRDDDCSRSLGEMVNGLEDGFVPKSDEDVLMVLERYGCDWTHPIVTYSFMQRDKAIEALNDPNRYQTDEDCFAGHKRVRWAYDDLVNDAITEFVLRHLPDAHDWEDGSYSVTSLDGNDGQAYRDEMDIPTSAQDCWLSFEVAIPNLDSEPMALFVQGIRSGIGDDEVTTYVCQGLDGEWKKTEPKD